MVALNLLSNSPRWLAAIGAKPMYLGLDLRGGVHFLLQVDMKGAITKSLDSTGRRHPHHPARRGGCAQQRHQPRGATAGRALSQSTSRDKAPQLIESNYPDLQFARRGTRWRVSPGRRAETASAEAHPGVRHPAEPHHPAQPRERAGRGRADRAAGRRRSHRGAAARRAEHRGRQAHPRAAPPRWKCAWSTRSTAILPRCRRRMQGSLPFGAELLLDREGQSDSAQAQVVLTGDRISDAQPGFDNQTGEPAVHITLDGTGARIFQQLTRENVGKRMAMVLVEKGKGEVVTAPVIRQEIGGGRVQISGRMTTTEARDVALLLRAGALAAPMEIVEERTVGPSLGADNIRRGFHATWIGFAAAVAVHHRLLQPVRRGFGDRPGGQPDAAGGAAVDAAGHLDPARHRRHRADAGHGDRRQRADQRAHPRGAAQRHHAAGGHPRRLRAGLGDHPRLQHHHADCRHRAVHVRDGSGARLRGGALPGDPDLHVQRGGWCRAPS